VASDASAVRWWHCRHAENQQAVDGDKQRDRLSIAGWSALFSLDLKESGYKVAWIEKSVQRQ
jgi:hypothetical protein